MQNQDQNTNLQRMLKVQRMYLKECLLEIPRAPEVFKEIKSLQNQLKLEDMSHWLEADIHEVVLSLTVEGMNEGALIYRGKVSYAVIAQFEGFTPEQREQISGTYLLQQIYPYALERLNSLMISASLPAIQNQLIDFEGMYRQKKSQQAGASMSQQAVTIN